jgi:hypothetical protein
MDAAWLRWGLRAPFDARDVVRAVDAFRRGEPVADRAYQAFIRLFCLTGGWSNDRVSRELATPPSPIDLPRDGGLLGLRDAAAVDRAADKLRCDGWLMREAAVPAEVCDRLEAFARSSPSRVRGTDIVAPYGSGGARGVRHDLSPEAVINRPDAQALMADRSLIAVAAAYLGAQPMADVTGMWWHTDFSHEPDADAAQFWHFDMDRPRWLKVFVYLTDVGPDNGPHCFVEGSHRNGGIPWRLRRRGYARLEDAEVDAVYPKSRQRVFVAPRGTLVVEDTRGLHKGLPVQRGERLMFQTQFSNSLFGASYPQYRLNRPASAALEAAMAAMPGLYDAFVDAAEEMPRDRGESR